MKLKTHRRGRSGRARTLVGSLVVVVAVPGLAFAGSKVTSGHQTLQVRAGLKPAKAGAGSILKLHIDYESLLPNQHVGDTASVQLQLPQGSHLNPHSYTQCDYNKLAGKPVSQDGAICPKDSVLGSGTFTADARPTVAQPVAGTFTLYNVKGHHDDVLLAGKTAYGYVSLLFLYTVRGSGGRAEPALTAYEQNNGGHSLYTIKTLQATIGRPHHRAFVTNPRRCTRSGWRLGVRIENFGSEPTIQAHDTIHCRK